MLGREQKKNKNAPGTALQGRGPAAENSMVHSRNLGEQQGCLAPREWMG